MATLLTGCFKGDPDAEAKCALLAEICGAAALGYATRLMQPRAVVLHGKTAENGKSQPPDKPRMSPDELAAFYAGLVNSDKYLPPSAISNAMRDLLLARGLVSPERLRMRGVR